MTTVHVEEHDMLGSDDKFWNKWQDISKKWLGYQVILTGLQQECLTQDKTDADAAQRYFDGNLDREDAEGVFCFLKRGESQILEEDEVVAKRWKILLLNPEIATKWEAMQSGQSSGST